MTVCPGTGQGFGITHVLNVWKVVGTSHGLFFSVHFYFFKGWVLVSARD